MRHPTKWLNNLKKVFFTRRYKFASTHRNPTRGKRTEIPTNVVFDVHNDVFFQTEDARDLQTDAMTGHRNTLFRRSPDDDFFPT